MKNNVARGREISQTSHPPQRLDVIRGPRTRHPVQGIWICHCQIMRAFLTLQGSKGLLSSCNRLLQKQPDVICYHQNPPPFLSNKQHAHPITWMNNKANKIQRTCHRMAWLCWRVWCIKLWGWGSHHWWIVWLPSMQWPSTSPNQSSWIKTKEAKSQARTWKWPASSYYGSWSNTCVHLSSKKEEHYLMTTTQLWAGSNIWHVGQALWPNNSSVSLPCLSLQNKVVNEQLYTPLATKTQWLTSPRGPVAAKQSCILKPRRTI